MKSNTCKFYDYTKTNKFLENLFEKNNIFQYTFYDFNTNYHTALSIFKNLPKEKNKKINIKEMENNFYIINNKPKYIKNIFKYFSKPLSKFENIWIIEFFWIRLKKILYKKSKFEKIDHKFKEDINKKFNWKKQH